MQHVIETIRHRLARAEIQQENHEAEIASLTMRLAEVGKDLEAVSKVVAEFRAFLKEHEDQNTVNVGRSLLTVR